MNATIFLLVILIIVRLWVGGQLLVSGHKYQLTNLYWLAIWSFVVAGYVISAPTTPPTTWSNPTFYYLGTLFGQFFLVMFMHTTFYQGRKSPILLFLFLLAAALILVIYLLLAQDFMTSGLISQFITVVNWSWHLWLAWQAYQAIAFDAQVETWVKGRYRLMIAYSLVIVFGNLIALPLATSLAEYFPPFVTYLATVLNLLGVILLFLVWVMPERFRLWLDRYAQIYPPVESGPDAESRAILKIFGTAMAENSSLTPIACMYSLRSTIGKILGSDDSDTIDNYISRMSYQDWEQLFLHPELRRSISHFADSQIVDQVLDNAHKVLVEKQSVLTMAAR